MKIQLFAGVALAFFASGVLAQTYVKGHTRKDGTYVAPHVRSSPNKTKVDNYGPAPAKQSAYGLTYSSPYSRDKDKDGISNQNDSDDDNDGRHDDYDPTP